MGIIYQNISSESNLFNDVCKLYTEAFPEDERRQTSALINILNSDPRFRIIAIIHDNMFVGFISYWQFEKFYYVEHLATQSNTRNLGFGKSAVNHLKTISQEFPIVIEVEPDVDTMTHRRIGFYKRLGFEMRDDIKYIQPPYSPDKNSLELSLMTFGECTTKELQEYAKIVQEEVYYKFY